MAIGLLAFFLYLYFAVGFDQILTVIQSINLENYAVYYALAFGSMLLVMFCWVISWKSLLGALKIKISLRKAFLYYWVGEFVDMVIPCPAVCGDATRLYLVHNETHESYGGAAAAGITNRILAYGTVTGGLIAGIAYLLTRENVPVFALGFISVAFLGALTWLGVLLYLAFKQNAADRIALVAKKLLKTLRIRRYSEGLSPKTLESLSHFHQGFRFFREHPKFLIKPILLHCLSFVLNLLVYVLVFNALGFGILHFDFFIVLYLLAGAVQDVTATFSVGGLEILLTNVFIFYGIPPAVSGVSAGILRIVTFWFPARSGLRDSSVCRC